MLVPMQPSIVGGLTPKALAPAIPMAARMVVRILFVCLFVWEGVALMFMDEVYECVFTGQRVALPSSHTTSRSSAHSLTPFLLYFLDVMPQFHITSLPYHPQVLSCVLGIATTSYLSRPDVLYISLPPFSLSTLPLTIFLPPFFSLHHLQFFFAIRFGSSMLYASNPLSCPWCLDS